MPESPVCAPLGIVRPQPLHLLARAGHYPVTLLLAPAGAGKSVLLQQWLQASGLSPVFIQLQKRDNEPGNFMRRVLHEIRSHYRNFDIAWFNPLQAHNTDSTILAEYFADALNALPPDTYLVLDDFHLLEDAGALALFAELILISPAHVHFILLSRRAENLPLTRLDLQGRVWCIEQSALRCSVEDIRALHVSMAGSDLKHSDYVFIQQMTEGWMVGVKLVLLACQRYGRSALDDFHGHAPEMIDYFGPVVFHALPHNLQQFYLCTALLDKFNAALCDHVLQRNDSAHVLERIRTRELFILPVAGKPGWYRYHSLLQRFLAQQLAR